MNEILNMALNNGINIFFNKMNKIKNFIKELKDAKTEVYTLFQMLVIMYIMLFGAFILTVRYFFNKYF